MRIEWFALAVAFQRFQTVSRRRGKVGEPRRIVDHVELRRATVEKARHFD